MLDIDSLHEAYRRFVRRNGCVCFDPEQVAVLPVSRDQRGFAEVFARELRDAGVRARVEGAERSLGRRVAAARERGVDFVVVVRGREVRRHAVVVERRGRDEVMERDAALEYIVEAVKPPG